jgi:hypothetical protein
MHARVLLCKQDELLELQEQLDGLDAGEKTAYFLHTRRQDRNISRNELLSKIGEKLAVYGMVLFRNLELSLAEVS